MKYTFTTIALLAVGVAWPSSSFAIDNKIFRMVPSSTSCEPGASGHVTVSTPSNQNLHVEVFGLPANTGFDLFIIQKSTPKFGLSWYQGDITTDSKGIGVADFVGNSYVRRRSLSLFVRRRLLSGLHLTPVPQRPLQPGDEPNTNVPSRTLVQFTDGRRKGWLPLYGHSI